MSTYYHDTIAADGPIYAGQGCIGTDGTVVGSPGSIAGPTVDTGDYGLQFNGTGPPAAEYVETGYSGSPNGNGPFTVEFWVMPAVNGGCILGANGAGGDVPDMFLQIGASLGAYALYSTDLGGGGLNYCIFDLRGLPSDCKNGVWNHVVVVWDGTYCSQYINGVRCGYAQGLNPFAPLGEAPLLIAASGNPFPGTANNFCDAGISNVALYAKPLSPRRIMAHFAARAGTPAYPASSTYTGDYYPVIIGDNPVAYYRCDETAGAMAVDRSGNGHHGAYGLGDYALAQPGAIYDGNAAVLLQEPPPSGGYDPTPAGLVTPLLSASYSTQFSVEAWVYPNALPTEAEICATCGDNATIDGYGFRMFIDTSGKLNVEITWVGSSQSLTAPTALPTGQYNYVVATYDGSNLTLYANGAQVAQVSAPTAIGPWRNNLVWGFMAQSNSTHTNQLGGDIDEPALYNYCLTPGQVYTHYIAGLGPITPPAAGAIIGNDDDYFEVQIYNRKGELVDIPQADIAELSLLDQLNGGSATSTISFIRDPNAIGAAGYLFSVLVWIWNGRIGKPVDPTWAGYMVDIDQEKTRTLGKITWHMEGDQKQLDRAAIYENVNPLVGGNPPLDAADYIRHLYTVYSPPGFCSLVCPATLFPMLPAQFQMMQLGQVIDTVLKSGRDDLGDLITWRVKRAANLQRTLLVQPDQNPNTISGVKFRMLFAPEQCSHYVINTKYSEICNDVTVQGGQDYITGLPVVGSYSDLDSIAEWGAWQQIISVWQLISTSAANSYAETFLDIHGNPQAMGDVELHHPDPTLLSGVWAQIWENARGAVYVAGSPDPPEQASIKQMRIGSVRFEVSRTRVKQTLTPQAPTPYLDKAVYDMGLKSANNGINLISQLPVNTQGNFVRAGGTGSAA